MSFREQQRDFSARTRVDILATLHENPEDWFTAKEILVAIPALEDISIHQVAAMLRNLREDGLVQSRAEGNASVWRIKPADGPVQPSAKPRPVKASKPAPNHPWKEPACLPTDPGSRDQPISCVLPAHLLTPVAVKACPSPEAARVAAATGPADGAAETDLAALGLPQRVDTLLADESFEDEPMPPALLPSLPLALPPLSQFYLDQALASATDLTGHEGTEAHGCNGRCRQGADHQDLEAEATRLRQENAHLRRDNADLMQESLQREQAHDAGRAAYIQLLLTIADDAAVNAEQLKDWPIWTAARALAPHFNLETCYA